MKRPAPVITDDAVSYWEGCRNRQLLLQQCKACDCLQFPHRSVCTSCRSRNLEFVEASGRGTVYSFTVVMRAPDPIFQPYVPYIVALVDLDEGPRLMSNLLCDQSEAKVGMAVVVDFDTDTDPPFPVFRPSA